MSRLILIFSVIGPYALGQTCEITPLVGYRYGGDFRVQQQGIAGYSVVPLHNTVSYGFAAGWRLDEDGVIEFRWIRQGSSVKLPPPPGQTINPYLNTSLNTFHGDFTREWLTSETEMVRPFLSASVGATRVAT